MTGLALALVLASATAHALWNFFMKRATSPPIFIWWMLVAASIALTPVAIVLSINANIRPIGWLFVLTSTALHIPYFLFLGRAYTLSDLSIVYPIARGIGSALVPLAAIFLLGENISLIAYIGIIAVFTGIFILYWGEQLTEIFRNPLKFFREQSMQYAAFTGVVITAISITDKVCINYVNPLIYEYFTVVGNALILLPYMVRHYGNNLTLREWKHDFLRISVSGVLYYFSYALLLFALTFSKVSYVTPARQVAVVIGTIMGNAFLKEPFGMRRVFCSILIVAGLVLISIAP